MCTNEVKKIVENKYMLQVNAVEKIKNVYKINASSKEYCLKVIKYELGHFLFIISAIKHLQEKEFKKIPDIIKTKDNGDYVKLGENYAYLTPWINARLCNYDNPLDIRSATLKLAELHKKSMEFNVRREMNPRIGWLKWIQTYKTRKNEILDFRYRINQKDKKSKFDEVYLNIMNEELERADRSIEHLIKSDYILEMKKEIKNKGFCHHDYAYHNVLIDNENDVNIIDFDYCILDTHLHDLASLLIRRMKYGKWDSENAREIIEIYNSINEVNSNHIEIIKAFIEFPQDYWQRGIQYYWEKKDWGEEFFLKKIQKYIEDRDQRQEFINEFEWRC
ncbi:CotS family spore coat protein [Clostridium ganghwense]|uniref:CotS family spore coat protein n=1 Tax=Clostridium ganghwense TaxID=312089 RepID=A0ABT4CLT0_9CLOT|nr:CotS family spore coat protein [Clostridium ganghwense]MCY6369888.1 CotS family spore coat protein [Clostridium ganghwense]